MLLNLFGNGFYAVSKRSRSGAVSDFSPTLKVTTRDLGEVVEIRVLDNGGGIAVDSKVGEYSEFTIRLPRNP